MKVVLYLFPATIIILLANCLPLLAQEKGDTTFQKVCAACHTIGKGKLIGPDLANVQTRHPEEWLIKFIKSSQSVISSGDKYADSLFKAYNQIPMPDHPNLTDEQIKELLTYIKEKSLAPETAAASTALPPGDSKRGRELFVGNIRFANNGAACNACHNVEMKGLLSGGALGKDLTHAVTRLSAAGVSGIVSGLPFPQMKETYASKPVTPQEISDLTAFLAIADKQSPVKASSHVSSYFLFGGASGIIILAILYSIFWIKRKKGPVNFFIFNRQIESI